MSETTVTNVTAGGRSGIGAAPLTVSVLNFDTSLGCDSATFQPCSERALLSLKFLIDAYRPHYPINQNIPNNEPVLLGGFLEDSFLGGGVSSNTYQRTITYPLQGPIFLDLQLCRTAPRRRPHLVPPRRAKRDKTNCALLPSLRPRRPHRDLPPARRRLRK